MSSLIKASFWLSLSELAFNLSGYVIHALMGRILDTAGYGRFSIIVTFTTMVIILIGRGLPISMSKYLSEVHKNDANQIFKIKKAALFLQWAVIVIVTLIYLALAPVFARILNDPTLTPLFQVSSLIIPAFALASFYAYYFTGIQEFGKKSFLKFFRSVAKIIFIVGLGYYFKVFGAIAGQALAPLSVYLVGYFLDPFSKVKNKKKPGFKNFAADRLLMKKLVHFAWPIVLFMLFYEFMITLNLYFVKAILQDDSLAGIYNAAMTVSRIPYYLFFFMSVILLPKVSESVARGLKKKTEKLLNQAFKYLLLGLFPTITILYLFSDSAMLFFYGSQYAAAGPIMSLLIIGFGFLTVFYVLTFVLNGAGLNKFPMYASLFGSVLNAVLNYFLIKSYGLAGSALATTITAAIILLIAFFYANKKIARFISAFSIAKYLAASLAIFWIGSYLSQGRYIFILWSFLLIAIYFIFIIIMRELGRKDYQYLIKALSRNKKDRALNKKI
ncbi:MAG: flippase [Candidatus Moranbacteria bacterium]|nr:flippase [Candidatus Moranbacteria bacterium]